MFQINEHHIGVRISLGQKCSQRMKNHLFMRMKKSKDIHVCAETEEREKEREKAAGGMDIACKAGSNINGMYTIMRRNTKL